MQTFAAQIDALGLDLPPAAIKIGLLPTRLHVEVLARRLSTVEAPFVVYDPVAIASTGTPWRSPACWWRCASTCCHVCRSLTPTVPSWKP